MVNVTLCFSAAQALLAAKAGATFVSPFVGRLDDIGQRHGADRRHHADLPQLSDLRPRSWSPRFATRSIVIEAAKLGAHVATLPPAVHAPAVQHPLTDKGLAAFLADWGKTGQTHPVTATLPDANTEAAGPTDLPAPEAVVAFLKAHPDFLAEHPDLFRVLTPAAAASMASGWPTTWRPCWAPSAAGSAAWRPRSRPRSPPAAPATA